MAAALAASAAALACGKSNGVTTKPIPIRPIAAPAVQTIEGSLALPTGDETHTMVVDAVGKRTVLVLSPGMLEGLGTGAKTGAQVRVIGEPATLNGAPAIRVTSIVLAPR